MFQKTGERKHNHFLMFQGNEQPHWPMVRLKKGLGKNIYGGLEFRSLFFFKLSFLYIKVI